VSILAFVFVLGVLIFVHELGHFVMARRIGVRVLTFSLGFGPKLLSYRRGDTEYCISAIPLGGYVKMAGETPEDARTGADDEFLSKTKWQRFQVLIMGPVMNIAFAIVVMALVLYQTERLPAYEDLPPVIGGIEQNSAAAAAGLQAGDLVLSVEGKAVPTWKEFTFLVATRAKRPTRLVVSRGGTVHESTVTPVSVDRYDTGDIGVKPLIHPEIIAVRPGEPAAEAGLQGKDVVLAAGGEQGVGRERLVQLIKSREGQPLDIEVRRAGTIHKVTVTPRKIDKDVLIGATIGSESVEVGPLDAVRLSFQRNWELTAIIGKTLAGLVTRDTSVKQLMGPVAMADLSNTAAKQESWIPLFMLMAMISLNLGLLNLLPIPVLDGGHITILALEGISRRDISMRVKEKMLLAGFVLLFTLMVTVIYNDLMRIQWIERLVPWR
jgi:regulator of sigma E protease